MVGVNQHGLNSDADRYIYLNLISFVYVPFDVFIDDQCEHLVASVDVNNTAAMENTAVCTAETSVK